MALIPLRAKELVEEETPSHFFRRAVCRTYEIIEDTISTLSNVGLARRLLRWDVERTVRPQKAVRLYYRARTNLTFM